MGVRRIFTRERPLVVFLEVAVKIFPRGSKSGEISFFLLKYKKMTLFAENVIEKC